VTDHDPTNRGEPVSSLAQLIRSRMQEHGWSYRDLELRSDHAVTRQRWQQLGSGTPQKKFPEPATLSAIAEVLQVEITLVVLAAGRAVGLDTRLSDTDLARLLPPGTELLTERMRNAILTMIRAAVTDARTGTAQIDPEASTGLTLQWPKSDAPSRRRPAETTHDDAR
jgi:hypothetical protein